MTHGVYQEPVPQKLPGREHYHRQPVPEPGLKTDETPGAYNPHEPTPAERLAQQKAALENSIALHQRVLANLQKKLREL